eukprot:757-Pyramimonas_sp.AAC.1
MNGCAMPLALARCTSVAIGLRRPERAVATRQRARAKPRSSLGHTDRGRPLRAIWARPAPMSTCSSFGAGPGSCGNRSDTTRRKTN